MINYGKYSFIDYLRLIFSMVMTYLLYRPARLVRHPIRLRGRSNIKFSQGFTCGYFCRLEAYSQKNSGQTLIIGKNLNIGDFCHITSVERIEFGDNILVGSSVFISDHDHGDVSFESLVLPPAERLIVSKPIFIADNVWIGEKVSILRGVTIGRNSVIGAGSVVTKSIPAYSVAVGVPAKVIKSYETTVAMYPFSPPK